MDNPKANELWQNKYTGCLCIIYFNREGIVSYLVNKANYQCKEEDFILNFEKIIASEEPKKPKFLTNLKPPLMTREL